MKIERRVRKEHCDRNPGERPPRAAPNTGGRLGDRLRSNGSRLQKRGYLTEKDGVKHLSITRTLQKAAPGSLQRSSRPRMRSSTRLKCAFIAYMNQTARMTRHVGRTRLVDGASSTLGGGLGMHRVYDAKHHTEGQKHLENLHAQKTGSNFKNRRMNTSKVPGHGESVGLQARAGKANGLNSCRYMAMSRLHICRKHEMAVA